MGEATREPRITPAASHRGYLEPIRAAGAVVHRGEGGGREIALIHRPWRSDWSLPKGKLKQSEHVLATAVREVAEEAGVRPVLGRRLAAGSYAVHGWPKQVEWWSATVGADIGFQAGDEVDAVEWMPIAEARDRLTYDHDVAILDDFAAGPDSTIPIVILRHATAGRKGEWNDDLLRPLDSGGRADARALAELLAVFGLTRVVTSAAARCVETVAPYVVAQEAAMRTELALTARNGAEGSSFDRAAACAVLADLISEGEPTVVCTHGELVSHLLRTALTHLGAPVSQQLSLFKGAFWVLHVSTADGTLAALERHGVRG